MIEAFLICALALPRNTQAQYDWLVGWMNDRYPGEQTWVLVNEQEALIGPRTIKTPYQFDGLRIWLIRTSALALPEWSGTSDYALLRQFIGNRHPEYDVVFIHPDETLLNPGAKYTGMVAEPEDGSPRLKIWTIKRSA